MYRSSFHFLKFGCMGHVESVDFFGQTDQPTYPIIETPCRSLEVMDKVALIGCLLKDLLWLKEDN